VNNVGGTETKAGGFEVLSDEDWQRILEVNLLAAIRLDRAFLPGMIERKSGVVIRISSVQHRLPFSNFDARLRGGQGRLGYLHQGAGQGCRSERCASDDDWERAGREPAASQT
jgi:NAD(P)-dependent dehydrogenase (short-subunit alcohol dehydrogenase family)